MVVFLCFGSYILQSNLQDKNKFKYTNKAAIRKSLKIVNSDNQQIYETAAYYLPQKRAPFFYKTCANTPEVLPVQNSLYWYDK